MKSEIALRPSYWASVSGGKDSLYMLNLILHNIDRYPLNGVVHFELEIDYPDKYEACIAMMKDTEERRERELGRPFSVTSSNPKYNAEYLDKIIKAKWLKILEEKENKKNETNQDFFKASS